MPTLNCDISLRTLVRAGVLAIAGATCFPAVAQQYDPKRPSQQQSHPHLHQHQYQAGSAPKPTGPISVPTYSPPIGAYPAAPINAPPAQQPPRHGGDRHFNGPILIAPTVGLPVSPSFGSGPVGTDGSVYAYYCPDFGAYYPHVTHCPSAWVIVAAQQGRR